MHNQGGQLGGGDADHICTNPRCGGGFEDSDLRENMRSE